MVRVIALALLSLVLVVAAAAPVCAQDETGRAVALSRDAAAAYEAGDLEQAAALYEQAMVLVEDPAFAFNLGAIYDELGDIANAYRYFGRYVELFPGASDRAEIEAYLGELLPELQASYAQLVVTSRPAGATVSRVVDGEERLLGRAPVDIWIEPGDVRLVLRLDGYDDGAIDARAVAGVRLERDVALREAAVVAPLTPVVVDEGRPEAIFVPDAPAAVVDDGPDRRPLTPRQRTGLLLAGSGVGVAGFGMAMMAVGQGRERDHNDAIAAIEPGSAGDADEIDQLASEARLYKVLGNVGVFAGAGIAVTGAVLAITGRHRGPDTARVDVLPLSGGAALLFSSRF